MKTLNDEQIEKLASTWTQGPRDLIRAAQAEIVALNQNDDYDYITTAAARAKFAPKLATDEYYDEFEGGWQRVRHPDLNFGTKEKYRRRKKPMAGGEWRKVSEGVTYPCWVKNGTQYAISTKSWIYRTHIPRTELGDLFDGGITDFIPITLPPPPAPEMSECEKAFMECDETEPLKIFKAGYEAAKVGGEK